MDDETDLPDLADLDLDDSTDDFWKLDATESLGHLDTSFHEFMSKSNVDNYDLNWSPTDTKTHPIKTSLPATPSSDVASRYIRSGSVSSENSLNSQSTITQYAKYGLTPVTYPSESSSTSSRSLSRLSNYSTASSNTTSGIPHPRTNSSNHHPTNVGIPTPSRSYTLRENTSSHLLTKKTGTTQPRTQLAKRASHIPAPASYSPPSPQRTISSSSTGSKLLHPRLPTSSQNQQKRIPQRASHIPTVRESIHRPGSPLHNTSGRASATPSRIGIRSPTPGGPRNSLFNTTTTSTSSSQTGRSVTPTSSSRLDQKRSMTPMGSRPSGLRPPGTVTNGGSNVRSASRIGLFKKTTS
ncbi:uncharacterized protein B0P05DRAFT_548247 [Gilbertella persicaria]|uniref:uncharacterized protein n=1 Tax=Gilbertella persicaria TaxID=101096 RepID=UPI00221E9054|nr:uncharacterized protein B0P05DRAFT_548247 [Gilbertella persicaria]KAI8074361.1 hypothetical protein B0P05DRAFT_548247 [Gilbertella persicaria]